MGQRLTGGGSEVGIHYAIDRNPQKAQVSCKAGNSGSILRISRNNGSASQEDPLETQKLLGGDFSLLESAKMHYHENKHIWLDWPTLANLLEKPYFHTSWCRLQAGMGNYDELELEEVAWGMEQRG